MVIRTAITIKAMKRILVTGILALALFFSLYACSAFAYSIGVMVEPQGSSVYKNAAPSSRVLTTVKKGELFLVIAREGDWYKIFALDNTIGYVPRRSVSIQWNDAVSIGMILDPEGYTYVFAGPSTNHAKKCKIPENQMFIIVGKDSWYRVVTKDRLEGFVLAGKVAEIWP